MGMLQGSRVTGKPHWRDEVRADGGARYLRHANRRAEEALWRNEADTDIDWDEWAAPADQTDEADDWTEIDGTCRTRCGATRILVQESGNYGNTVALCEAGDGGCGAQWDYTPIDHKGILREARRGFL